MDGISVHADSASVNLNFWVTPDEANLDPSSGGLIIYPKAPPNGGSEEGSEHGEVRAMLPRTFLIARRRCSELILPASLVYR